MSYKHLRKDYKKSIFDFHTADPNPFNQFKLWLNEAIEAGIEDVNAMCLSTVNSLGKPSSRYVLLKEFNEKGIVFFTNYLSHKSKDVESNSNVCLNFYWTELERQVRIEGTASKISSEESQNYFDSRPLESRISAIASPQSARIESKQMLEDKIAYLNQHPEEIKCPEHWGGYVVVPNLFEFWQGREDRLHDRLEYQLKDDIVWGKNILAP